MKPAKRLFFLVLSLTFMLAGYARSDQAPERIVWDKVPIQITLPVGIERVITFPGNVRLGLPATLSARLRSQSNQGNIYWLAHEPFEVTRIQVQDIESKTIYLVDLQATADKTHTSPVIIQLKEQAPETNQTGIPATARKSSLDYVLLTRFAAQQLYAPARLLKTPQGIHRSPVKQIPRTHLIRGQAIEATPIATWRKGRLFVTALQLKNQGDYPILLDPRWVRGTWLTATFQHALLSPSGSERDTTALYLISDRPFSEVL